MIQVVFANPAGLDDDDSLDFVVILAPTVVGVRMAARSADFGLGVESSPTAFLARSFSFFPLHFDSLSTLIQREILLVQKTYINPPFP